MVEYKVIRRIRAWNRRFKVGKERAAIIERLAPALMDEFGYEFELAWHRAHEKAFD